MFSRGYLSVLHQLLSTVSSSCFLSFSRVPLHRCLYNFALLRKELWSCRSCKLWCKTMMFSGALNSHRAIKQFLMLLVFHHGIHLSIATLFIGRDEKNRNKIETIRETRQYNADARSVALLLFPSFPFSRKLRTNSPARLSRYIY